MGRAKIAADELRSTIDICVSSKRMAKAQADRRRADDEEFQKQLRTAAAAAAADRAAEEARRKKAEAEQVIASREHEARCLKAAVGALGMSKEEIRASKWGEPWDYHVLITAGLTRDQWVYERGPNCGPETGPAYLYFENGILVAIQK